MRRVLLITAGATPQVVTETVWALAHRAEPWIPHEIVLVTTSSGARLYERGEPARGTGALLGDNGKLDGLFRVIATNNAAPEVRMRVPEHSGRPIEDLRTDAEVEHFAEMLLEEVDKITANPETVLHMSLAGGRKTMSFLAGQVMSLLGRPRDVLSHVLVEPASLENPQSGFWWPGDGSPGSDKAKVLLHEVPFLRVRAWVEIKDLLEGPPGGRFAAAVERANRGLGEPDVTLDLAGGALRVDDAEVPLAPKEAALLGLILVASRRDAELSAVAGWDRDDRKRRAPALDNDHEAGTALWAWLTAAADLGRIYGDAPIVSFGPFDARVSELITQVDHDAQNSPQLSRIRSKLREKLPPALAKRILIPRGLGTALAPERLKILCPADLADHPGRPPELDVMKRSPSA